MSYLTLSMALIFVFIPIVLSKVFKLGLEKDTVIATVRSIIQLLILAISCSLFLIQSIAFILF